jgi:thymidylate kinase
VTTVGHSFPQIGEAIEPLPISAGLVQRLRDAGVRYVLYKNQASISQGLAGLADLDLLVAEADMDRFHLVLSELLAIRGLPSRFHDNAVEGREDWFVPDFDRCDYLHLDVTSGLRIGRKFRKRHLAFTYEDVRGWNTLRDPLPPMPVVHRQEEARIALLRSAFRLPLHRRWLPVSGLARNDDQPFTYRVGTQEVTCPVRDSGGTMMVEGQSVRRLRDFVLRSNGGSRLTAMTDLFVHQTRRLIHSAMWLLTAWSPSLTVAKRWPAPGGTMVALFGPDGVGKSTQVARLAGIFGKKLRCTTVYLGSIDSSRKLRRIAWRLQGRSGEPNNLYVVGSALSGLANAVARYVALLLGRSRARAGAIVFSDRWPQNLQPGLMDGPRARPARPLRIALLSSWMERRICDRLENRKPDLTIHLVARFETSRARKPGDIAETAFAQRIQLMNEMRKSDADIVVIDADQELGRVTADLFKTVWLHLWTRTQEAAAAQFASARAAMPAGA